MGSDVPDVAGRIGHRARAVAVELVLHRSYQLGAGGQRALHDAIDVLDVQHDADRRAADPAWTQRADLGMLVGEHDGRVADLDLGVPDSAARRGDADLLDGCERLLVEVDGLRRVVADQVRRRRVVAIGNRLDVAHHELLLRSTIPLAARRDSYATRVPAQTSGAPRRSDAPRRPPSTDTRPRSSATASIARHR